MKWFVFKRAINNHWRKRWLRVSTAATVLSAAICIQYFVSRIAQPQDVEEAKATPATSKVKLQEIVIHGPLLNNNVLLTFDGKNDETVEVRANKAALTPDTVVFLQGIVQGQKPPPPIGLEEIDYLIKDDQDAAVSNSPNAGLGHAPDQSADSCRMFVVVRTIDKGLPSEIHFYQPELGNPAFQAIEISAIGSNLEVQLRQEQPESKKPEGNPWAAGCKKHLTVGNDWDLVNNGKFEASFTVPQNEIVRFDFTAFGSTPSLLSGDGTFEPFLLGERTLKAKAVSVIPHITSPLPASLPKPFFSVQGSGDSELLSVNSLRETSEELQLRFSGFGLVEFNSKPAKTVSLFDLISKYPLPAAIFAAANLALSGWVIQTILNRNKSSSTG